MESLSQPAEAIAIPLVISVPAYLRDHYIGDRVVLPAVEALQIVARSRPDDLDGHSCRQERAFFHHPLTIDPGATEIPAVHEHVRYADGRCLSRLTTLRSGRQIKFTRRMEHLSVWFVPAGREVAGCGAGREAWCETASPSDPGDAVPHVGPTFRVSADRLYDELVPFGPAYRNVRGDVFLTETCVSATVSGGDFPEAAGPLGSPFPLDAAMHAACAWGQRYRNRVVFPVGFNRREILSPTRAGETYLCRITPLPDEGAVLCFDVRLHDLQRRPVETIRGLKMRDIFGGKRTPPVWVREGL
jgi:Polyketide synthase dehydratase